MIDFTHDPGRRSWVESADGHTDFPLQNLPFGVFSPGGGAARGGVAIGDFIFDVAAALEAGVLDGAAAEAAARSSLNGLMGVGAGPRLGLRHAVFGVLAEGAPASVRGLGARLLHPAAECSMHLPATIGDYSDFYAGIHHAMNGGKMLRPDNPLMANYKYVPVAYHGRASSVMPSGTPVRRPSGQRKPANADVPTFGPCRNLDYELEMGVWIGPGNALGHCIPIEEASQHVAGFCLLNDWSARDIQGWEYQPLGPFLAKSFQTTISPWVITPEALAPFRMAQPARPGGDPDPLEHLLSASDQASGGLDLEIEVLLRTLQMRSEGLPAHRLSIGHARHLYWTVGQMVAHHASGGCNLRAGDLFGTGTISSPEEGGWGSLLEISMGGRREVLLSSGETRRFLSDGDEVVLRARGVRAGAASIGFGECRGVVLEAM